MSLFKFYTRLTHRIRSLKSHPAVERFLQHNQIVFSRIDKGNSRVPEVLFELNLLRSSHIAYSYLATVLADLSDAKIVAYTPHQMKGAAQWLKFFISRIAFKEPFETYRSFGTASFFAVTVSRKQKKKAELIYKDVIPALKTKWDIEALSIDGVRIGDLIYDNYLNKYNRPTIDLSEFEFHNFLLDSIELFVFWDDYIKTHDVRAINVSHCVYNLAIPLRLAVGKNIPVYQSSLTHVYRLTEKNLFAYNDFLYYKEKFAALEPAVRTVGIDEAKSRINRRFSGEVGVDMSYSTKSAFGEARHARLLRDTDRKKILIATHCFFDSPHSYGDNVFPDFYEWLDFLGKMTEMTDYDWYIKTHPDYLPGTMQVIDYFVEKYPRLTLLPSNSSHLQLVAEGIDLALTVYGTIAFEYAALGIPVINASKSNPHVAYDFNLHADNQVDYERLLKNFPQLAVSIEKHQVYEYYFMRNIYNTQNIFFPQYDKTVDDLGGYYEQFKPKVFDRWMEDWSPALHESIIKALNRFIASGDFRMDQSHFELK
jgi:hypothetical protein